MANQALDEQETSFTIEATDRKALRIFSNDGVWQNRIEKLGIQPTKTSDYGKWYLVSLDEFGFGIRKKRQMSEEQRYAAAERLAAYRDSGEEESVAITFE